MCPAPLPPAAKCTTMIGKKRLCSVDCASQWAMKQAVSKRERDYRKSRAEARDRLKTRQDWLREAQTAFNLYVRMRDYGLPCHSCGSTPAQKRGGTMDCSHYRSVGSAPHMRFNVFNAASACVKCNRELSGNIVELRKGLITKFGVGIVERVESDQSVKKYTIDQLKRLKKVFAKRASIRKKRYNLG